MNNSTLIPSIGMTFTAAAARVAELVAEHDALKGDDDAIEARREELEDEYSRLDTAILTTEPKTLGDAIAVLDRLLCPSIGLPISDVPKQDLAAIRRVGDLLIGLSAGRAANDAPDAFGAAVMKFDAAAKAVLSMPQSPTARMTAAGMTATGASAETVMAMYSAMVEAHKKERAA